MVCLGVGSYQLLGKPGREALLWRGQTAGRPPRGTGWQLEGDANGCSHFSWKWR